MIYRAVSRRPGKALSLLPAIVVLLFSAQLSLANITIHKKEQMNPSPEQAISPRMALAQLEQRLIDEGLVNVRHLDPSIMVELKYSSADNFMGYDAYYGLRHAYLRPEAAHKLALASSILQQRHANLRLVVGDAVRPRSVQQQMWQWVVGTAKQIYVADPMKGSMHNYGAAVDVTLFDVNSGERLDMGTPFDYFGKLAQPYLEQEFLRQGKLSRAQIDNRLILRHAMVDAGWHVLNLEWWHFDAFPKPDVRRSYSIIE